MTATPYEVKEDDKRSDEVKVTDEGSDEVEVIDEGGDFSFSDSEEEGSEMGESDSTEA